MSNAYQSKNFSFLQPDFTELYSIASQAEQYIYSDPQASMAKQRLFIEMLLHTFFKKQGLRNPGYSLDQMIKSYELEDFISLNFQYKLDSIRSKGNQAVHQNNVTDSDSINSLKITHDIAVAFYVCMITNSDRVKENSDFAQKLIDSYQPYDKTESNSSATSTKKHESLMDEIEQQNQQLKDYVAQLANTNKVIDELTRKQNAKQSRQILDTLVFNEAQTRQYLIDSALFKAGWDIDLVNSQNTDEVSREHLTQYRSDEGAQNCYCDYVLWNDDGMPLAVIEAKKTSVSVQIGKQQAKIYADALQHEFGVRPIIFYSNGFETYIWNDSKNEVPRKIYGLYSKTSLQRIVQQRDNKNALSKTPIDTSIVERSYQIEAIQRVCERFENEKKRKALIVLATGTGKTRIAIALSRRLIQAGWIKNVLFLCDRKELRKQAAASYGEFVNEPVHAIGGVNEETDLANAQIVVATYPAIMSRMDKIDVGFFDLIIADESHRSIYNIYGDIFKHFDALQIGLTATPVEMISRSTTELFGCERHIPTANYPIEQAVADGYLVPYQLVAHTTKFMREGIHADKLTAEQLKQLEDQGYDIADIEFDSKVMDTQVFNKDTNRQVLRNLVDYGIKLADGETLGKSIIFARNIRHAELLHELFCEMYPEKGGNFCRVIHSNYDYADTLISSFKKTDNSSDQITVAISVDMLDTGIDVPSVVNLVFAKPVKSKVKFWQMIGRGTRLCPNLFGEGEDKSRFLIFDHWDNFSYHDMNTDESDIKIAKPISTQKFELLVDLAQTALKHAHIAEFESIVGLIKESIDDLNDDNVSVKEHLKTVHQMRDSRLLTEFTPAVQNTLLNTIAKLMPYRNHKNRASAIAFDMLMMDAQRTVLTHPIAQAGLSAHSVVVAKQLQGLKMQIQQVRTHADIIKQLRDEEFWRVGNLKNDGFSQLESARTALRDIIHLQEKEVHYNPSITLDVSEDESGIVRENKASYLYTIDYEIYKQEVEKTITPLMDRNITLQKIKRGEPVTDEEIDELNKLVHTQNSTLDLDTLQTFYPESSARLDDMLRMIVGYDPDTIADKFESFIRDNHLELNSLQIRFLDLLRQEICRNGYLMAEQVFEAPFANLHQDGIDGVFADSDADKLFTFIRQFNKPVPEPKPAIEISRARA